MTVLWAIFGVMLIAGVLLVCWPIYRHQKRLSAPLLLGAISVIAISGCLYALIGAPGKPSGAAVEPSVDDMVTNLAARLAGNPEDVAGWKMLGRSYLQQQQFDQAVAAYEQALEREGGSNGQTLADLGEAVLMQQDDRVVGRAAELFEASLAVTPDNPKALFYGGIAAIERNDPTLAAARWEALLAQSPPENVQAILRQRISEWRGAKPLVDGDASMSTAVNSAALTAKISISAEALAALPGNASVFVIARDPAQPSPPIAVARRTLQELPATVTLTDADAMIPGRTIGQFTTIELIVRASASGDPLPANGDWFGSMQFDLPAEGTIDIVIANRVD